MGVDNHGDIRVPVPHAAQTCAIVILFHPEPRFQERLLSLLTQFNFVILIDNTPGESQLGELPGNVQLIRNGRNLGIAAALNQGVLLALKQGHTWIATFDQDSDLLPGYLEKVTATAKEHTPNPAIIGCNYFIGDSNQTRHTARPNSIDAQPRVVLITSGSFMPTQFVYDIGGFREDYFIDSVDHEFCLRASHHGAAILMTTKPFMRHRMGEAGIGVGQTLSYQHQPLRRYYIARNSLATMRSHGLRHPLWAMRQLGRLTGEAFAIIAFESRKAEKLTFFIRGLLHGIVGRSGPFEDA